MNLSKIIESIKSRDTLFSLLGFIFLVAPGVTVIFLFDRDLFLSLDWIKLILLSVSIVVPVAFFNTLFLMSWDNVKPHEKEGLFKSFIIATLITGLLIDSTAFVGFWFEKPMWWSIKMLIVFECLFVLGALYKERKVRRKKKDEKVP